MTNQKVSLARKRAAKIRYQAMHDKYANPCCQACDFCYPPVVHGHHIRPVAETNGASDELIWLCPNCHAMVHEIKRVYHSQRKASNLEMRVSHLSYWLTDVCPSHIAKKLCEIAERTR